MILTQPSQHPPAEGFPHPSEKPIPHLRYWKPSDEEAVG